MDRRKFIKNVATASAATFVLPRFSIAQTKSPNSKLNVAFVGVGGVGGMAIEGMSSENAVAPDYEEKKKKRTGDHGYGLKILEDTAEKYGGHAAANQSGGIFTCVFAARA